MLISGFWRKTKPLVCATIEAQEHTIQLLEALGTILPAGSTDPRVRALLTGLSCTAFPTWEALYKQLGNLRLFRRESMLRAAGNRDSPTQDILRKAPLVSSLKEDQLDAVVVAYAEALRSVLRSRPWWHTQPWTKRTQAPLHSKPSFPEEAKPKSTDFWPSRCLADCSCLHQHGTDAWTRRSIHGFRRGTGYPSLPFPLCHTDLYHSDCQTILLSGPFARRGPSRSSHILNLIMQCSTPACS